MHLNKLIFNFDVTLVLLSYLKTTLAKLMEAISQANADGWVTPPPPPRMAEGGCRGLLPEKCLWQSMKFLPFYTFSKIYYILLYNKAIL